MHTTSVPGRVNLIGDHTDYNGGLALPVAVDRRCTVDATPIDDPVVRATSSELDGRVTVPLDTMVEPRAVLPRWGRFVAGAVEALRAVGADVSGAELVVRSTIPLGAGLSSSSALAVALTLALAPALAAPLRTRAAVALDAEVRATGVPGGLMDQLTALAGRAGHALLLDFDDVSITPVPIPAAVSVLVVHCGKARTLADSEYASRRAECEAVVASLALPSLRAATAAQVAASPRARHVVSENARVLEAVAALRAADLPRLGELMRESHASLRDDYEVSTPELDALTDALCTAGASGARLTGAGFGGCVVAVADAADASTVLQRATSVYRAATGLEAEGFVATAVDGVLAGDADR